MPRASSVNLDRSRRRRRAVLGLPMAALAWVGVSGLPFSPAVAGPGTMHSTTITLSGPDGEATASAAGSTRALRSVPVAAPAGWSATVDVPDGTQAVGLTWTGAAHGAVQVRGLGPDGWTDWDHLEADPEDKPDPDDRDAGGLSWFGREGVDEVQVEVTAGALADLEVQTMRYEEPSGGGFVTAVAGADAPQPTILPRSTYTSKGWATGNSGCSSGPVTASGGVKLAVVHHTVNSNTYAAADVPAMLASIYAYHTGSNGWCDIAYNFVVDRFGRIWEGRSGGIDKAIVGGHAAGFNTGTMGVSLLGQYEPGQTIAVGEPSSDALDAAAKVIGWKLGLFGVDPTSTVAFTSGGSNKYAAGTVVTLPRVVGHRDVGLTACPGANLYDKLAGIRTAAKAYQGTVSTTTTSSSTTAATTTTQPLGIAPFATVSALVTQQYRDVLHRDPTSAELSTWTPKVGQGTTPAQFIAGLTTSSEADDRVHAVTRLYTAYFLRNPDHTGLQYWLNQRGKGRTITSISQSFAVSSEFVRRYGSLTDAQFVDRVYQNVLGRAAEADGLRYWTERLAKGTPRGQVMANFSQSSEYIRKMAADVQVTAVYEAMLQRAAPSDEFTFFTTGLRTSATSLTSVVAYLFESDAYRARFS